LLHEVAAVSVHLFVDVHEVVCVIDVHLAVVVEVVDLEGEKLQLFAG
jgi:hypothetical protein